MEETRGKWEREEEGSGSGREEGTTRKLAEQLRPKLEVIIKQMP
jgi:hypothetical protein